MAGRTDFYKEYLEDNFTDTKYTTISEDKEEYKYLKDIITSLGMSSNISDANDKGEKDSLDLGKVYLAEYDFEGTPKNHYVMVLFGGLNGPGKWHNYFETFIKAFDAFDEKCGNCWLIELTNDCADDVYTAYVGVEIPKNLKESIPHRNKVQQFLQEFLDQLSAKVNEGLPTNGFLDKSE